MTKDEAIAAQGVEIDRLCRELLQAHETIARMKAERLKLDRRIHNQRASCRKNWMIFEGRRKMLGSPDARRMYINLLKQYRELRSNGQS